VRKSLMASLDLLLLLSINKHGTRSERSHHG
jgi:hypothetical protein